jgi:hypothetical protein
MMSTVHGMETGIALDDINKEVTLARLQSFNGHRAKTARSLGISLRTLGLWLKEWGQPEKPSLLEIDDMADTSSHDGAEALMKQLDLSTQLWREYRWIDPNTERVIKERFDNPIEVFFSATSITHRVVHKDINGTVVSSSVPAVGYFGCVITWQNRDIAASAAIA